MQPNNKELLDLEVRKSHYQELLNMKYKDKVFIAKKRIKEFFNECAKNKEIKEITISFSGGKDSTVLLDLVLKVHKEINYHIPLVMVYATEITFPTTIKFIKEINEKYRRLYPNALKEVQLVLPKKTWIEILSQNGYPIYSKQISTIINRVKKAKTQNRLTKWFFGIDKNITSTSKFKLSRERLFLLDDAMLNGWKKEFLKTRAMKDYFLKYEDKYFFSEKCCDFIKGNLKHDKRPSFIGTMAKESQLRKKSWIQYGCNIFNKHAMKSRPLSIWTTNDIFQYIKENNLQINPAYNYDISKPLNEQNLRFDRLGCTSCPYGSFMEQKLIEKIKKDYPNATGYKTLNRFEILKNEYPNLYLSQVIANGMYKVLIDMGIKINNDKLYMQLFKARRKQIDEWYDNERINILRIMAQIENYNDYKKKGKQYEWKYSFDQYQQAMNHFGFKQKITKDEIKEIRKQVASNYNSNQA